MGFGGQQKSVAVRRRWRPVRRAASLLATALFVVQIIGCAGDSRPTDIDPLMPDPDECQAGQPYDLTGRFAIEAVLNVLVNASIIRDKPAISKAYILFDVTQTGLNLAVKAQICRLEIPPVALEGQEPLMLTPGPGLLASIKEYQTSGTLSGPTTCSQFRTENISLLFGADVTPSRTGILPQTSTAGVPPVYCSGDMRTDCDPDPLGTNCACDQERDDKPGATLLADNVPGLTDLKEVYGALRLAFSLNAQVFSSNDIRGTFVPTLDIGILDCMRKPTPQTSQPCSAQERSALRGFSPTILQHPQNLSTFRSVRVSNMVDCKALDSLIPELFPR